MRGYQFTREPYYPVLCGTEESIGGREYKTLVLIWPDWNSPVALNCLKKFKGDTLIYVGEVRGCTADDKFQNKVDSEWEHFETVAIPSWQGLHDDMHVFKRK